MMWIASNMKRNIHNFYHWILIKNTMFLWLNINLIWQLKSFIMH